MRQIIFVLTLFSSLAFAQSKDSIRYTVILSGNKAGFQTVAVMPQALHIHYEFNDRGRGPKMDETIALSPQGIPVKIESKGVDYFKAPVLEVFTLTNGKAAWKNRAEQGEKQITGNAFYSSISGTPEEVRLLVKAALQSPRHKLALIPEGEVSVEKKTVMKLAAGGRQRTFILYWLSGLGFTPNPIWLTEDGQYMASVGSWFSQVPDGWESIVAPLTKAQDSFSEKRAGELATALAHKPAKPLVFVHANLFDSETAQSHPGSTVVITGNKITAVGPDGRVTVPAAAEVIDATGKTLMPGLWDMHVHLQPNDGLLHMANGVTSVRDMANDTEMLMQMRDRFDHGTEIGPRVLMAGFIDGRGPFQGPTKVFADNEEEARKDVDNYARLGYVQIKVYSSLKPELVPKIAQMAHSHGLRLSGHVPAGMIASDFIRDGADEVQHMNFILLNFMPDVKDTRTPARFTEVAARAADIDPNSDQVQAFIHLLQEHKTVVDPTLSIFEDMFTNRPGQMPPGWADVAERMPSDVRRSFLYGGIELPKNETRSTTSKAVAQAPSPVGDEQKGSSQPAQQSIQDAQENQNTAAASGSNRVAQAPGSPEPTPSVDKVAQSPSPVGDELKGSSQPAQHPTQSARGDETAGTTSSLDSAKSLGHDMNPGPGTTATEPINWDQRFRQSFRSMQRMTRALYDAGVPIVAGTDSMAGFALHRELEIYVESGIPAPKVLQLATLGAARIMKRDSQLGRIAPGKLADVILVDGNPAQQIKDIEHVETVVKDGVVYKVADLDKAIGVRPN